MCISMTMLMAIGTAASAVGTIMNGQAQQETADAQAQSARNQAAYEADSYKAQAEKIRRAGKSQQGEAKAALAASGVQLGEGTALEVQKNITQNTEEDALNAMLSGKRAVSSADAQASMLEKSGSNAMTNSVLSAGATVANGGWKLMSKGK